MRQWAPVMPAMLRMPAELRKDPERGLLSRVLLTASPRTYCVVRYWESKEKLHAYASAPDAFRHRAWARVDRLERRGKVRGHVGIWHEAYIVPEGSCEAVYGDMPAFGLAAAHGGSRWGSGAVCPGPVRTPVGAVGGEGRRGVEAALSPRRGQPVLRRASDRRAAASMTAWACIRPG